MPPSRPLGSCAVSVSESFQRLFTTNQRRTKPTATDVDTFELVFGTRDVESRRRLPRDTSLQRAHIRHIDRGGHWHGGVGWWLL